MNVSPTDDELLVWINGDKGYRGLAEVGRKFEREVGIKIVVEHPEGLTDKFQAAAENDNGPDIVFWMHDRLGEWVNAGLLRPINVPEDFKRKFLPISWDAVTHKQEIYGYPLALEVLSLIYNKRYVPSPPPTQLGDLPAFAKQLKNRYPNVITIMWDYKIPYFSWPFLASAGAYPFKKYSSYYDPSDIGVDTPGAVKALAMIVDLINEGILPRSASYTVMEQKMSSGELAIMISGPSAWHKLRKCEIDFGLAPIPGIDGNPGRPFVGVLTALINRSTPHSDFATQFIEQYVATDDGLKCINADVPIGVPALKTAYDEMSAQEPLIQAAYENALRGEMMPNIPQMGKFWNSMQPAIQNATNGQLSPQAALKNAKKNMEK
jgi:maltose/maltodextrin transport system substrate-binding protein